MSEPDELIDVLPQIGTCEWIGLSSRPRAEMTSVEEVVAEVGSGLTGDYHAVGRPTKREVTLIQAEHLTTVASLMHLDAVPPEATRRNLVVRGINLLALQDRRFRVGEVVLEGAGDCPPCSRMEENLGEGGLNAMRGHGGIIARVITGGSLRRGDPVSMLATAAREETTTG